MSNPSATKIITARTADVGGIPVARVLPTREQRMIGPWCFLDHAGPVEFSEHEQGLQVGPHPHTCLQTFTWMMAGEVMHRDSLGSEQIIRPQQVNLMTAGYGISHTESSLISQSKHLHAAQLWIALPADKANIAPRFDHYPELPVSHSDGVQITVLVGEFQGVEAPTLHYSPIVGAELLFQQSGSCTLTLNPAFEHGLFVLTGQCKANQHVCGENELGVWPVGTEQFTITAEAGCRVLLIGGEPFAQPVTLWWNFVGHDKAYLRQAQQQWHARNERFGSAAKQRALANAIPHAEAMDGPPVPW